MDFPGVAAPRRRRRGAGTSYTAPRPFLLPRRSLSLAGRLSSVRCILIAIANPSDASDYGPLRRRVEFAALERATGSCPLTCRWYDRVLRSRQSVGAASRAPPYPPYHRARRFQGRPALSVLVRRTIRQILFPAAALRRWQSARRRRAAPYLSRKLPDCRDIPADLLRPRTGHCRRRPGCLAMGSVPIVRTEVQRVLRKAVRPRPA